MIVKGKAKTLEAAMLMTFRDDVTAGNNEKHDIVEGKGAVCCAITQKLMLMLEYYGINTHFLKPVHEDQMLVKQLEMIPIEVVVRNVAAGSICRRLGLHKGFNLSPTLVEFYLKDDTLGDPLVTVDHIELMNIASRDTLRSLNTIALEVNRRLYETFNKAGLLLVDFKLEFGFDYHGNIVLGDEISPDSCRLWCDGKSTDKDIFRNGEPRDLLSVYKEVLEALA